MAQDVTMFRLVYNPTGNEEISDDPYYSLESLWVNSENIIQGSTTQYPLFGIVGATPEEVIAGLKTALHDAETHSVVTNTWDD